MCSLLAVVLYQVSNLMCKTFYSVKCWFVQCDGPELVCYHFSGRPPPKYCIHLIKDGYTELQELLILWHSDTVLTRNTSSPGKGSLLFVTLSWTNKCCQGVRTKRTSFYPQGSTLRPIQSQMQPTCIVAHVTKTAVAFAKLWLDFTQTSSPDGKCD